MNAPPDADLLVACRTLFGTAFEPAFLGALQKSGLRSAWRLAALRTHPDRVTDPAARRLQAERFIEARRAYGLLSDFLGARGLPGSHAAQFRAPAAAPPRPSARRTHRPQPHPPCGWRRPAAVPAPALPRRPLRFGEFLYHSRVISCELLVEALVWQRRQRERFCEIARRWGHITEADASRLLADRRPHEPVGAAAQRLKLLNVFQVRTVLTFQRSRQRPLGGYFVDRGLLSPADLGALLHRLEGHNAALRRT